jgi:DNA-binding NtrC family response regulator
MESKMEFPEVHNFQVRKEIILLLGADPHGDRVMQRTLEAVGYPVLTADNGEQAQDLFTSFNSAIRLLIVDIALKEESALEVIAALHRRNPTMKVIVASKEVSPRERDEIFFSGAIGLIRKPVDKEQLLQVVREIV